MKIATFAVGAMIALVVPTIAGRTGQDATNDQQPEQFTRVCGNCHSPDRIVSSRRSRDQWQEVVDNMVGRGAQGTDADLFAVMKYLVTRHGRVNMNRALPEEIVEVLAIPTGDAEKIVEYRKTHGRFEDMDALVKVPGLDVEKIKNQRDAIMF